MSKLKKPSRVELANAESLIVFFLTGCYFTTSTEIPGAFINYSDLITDSYRNVASGIDVTIEEVPDLINKVSTVMKGKKRTPAFYVTPFTRPQNFPTLLEKAGFNEAYSDAWMFFGGQIPVPPKTKGFRIQEVKTEKDRSEFLTVFDQAYTFSTGPDEPYGGLPKGYRNSLSRSFRNKKVPGKTIKFHLGYEEEKAVAISSFVAHNGFACINDVGTHQKFRGEGFGTAMTMHALREAVKVGAKVVFLQTAHQSKNEKLYSKLGFSTEFVGRGFEKES